MTCFDASCGNTISDLGSVGQAIVTGLPPRVQRGIIPGDCTAARAHRRAPLAGLSEDHRRELPKESFGWAARPSRVVCSRNAS
jgi:hypothetical protein